MAYGQVVSVLTAQPQCLPLPVWVLKICFECVFYQSVMKETCTLFHCITFPGSTVHFIGYRKLLHLPLVTKYQLHGS